MVSKTQKFEKNGRTNVKSTWDIGITSSENGHIHTPRGNDNNMYNLPPSSSSLSSGIEKQNEIVKFESFPHLPWGDNDNTHNPNDDTSLFIFKNKSADDSVFEFMDPASQTKKNATTAITTSSTTYTNNDIITKKTIKKNISQQQQQQQQQDEFDKNGFKVTFQNKSSSMQDFPEWGNTNFDDDNEDDDYTADLSKFSLPTTMSSQLSSLSSSSSPQSIDKCDNSAFTSPTVSTTRSSPMSITSDRFSIFSNEESSFLSPSSKQKSSSSSTMVLKGSSRDTTTMQLSGWIDSSPNANMNSNFHQNTFKGF